MGFTDQGKCSKTVPFDKITDCDIEEPAGNSCFCVPNILFTVNIDTASSGTEGKKELKLAGLKDPHSFKKLVWAMKRSQKNDHKGMNSMVMTDRGGNGSSEDVPGLLREIRDHVDHNKTGEDVAGLLREIRDELRVNNSLLQNQKQQQEQQTFL